MGIIRSQLPDALGSSRELQQMGLALCCREPKEQMRGPSALQGPVGGVEGLEECRQVASATNLPCLPILRVACRRILQSLQGTKPGASKPMKPAMKCRWFCRVLTNTGRVCSVIASLMTKMSMYFMTSRFSWSLGVSFLLLEWRRPPSSRLVPMGQKPLSRQPGPQLLPTSFFF